MSMCEIKSNVYSGSHRPCPRVGNELPHLSQKTFVYRYLVAFSCTYGINIDFKIYIYTYVYGMLRVCMLSV